MLRDNLQPTDFADAEVRVSDWVDFHGSKCTAYRVWICRCTNWWFQRHEWQIEGLNSTRMDEWILNGYWPHRKWAQHMKPAPKDYDQ